MIAGVIASTGTDILLGIGRLLILVAVVSLVMFIAAWLWWNFEERVYDPIWEKYIHPWSDRRHDRKMKAYRIKQAGREAEAAKRRELEERDDYY